MKQKLLFIFFAVFSYTTVFAQSEKETIARNWLEANKYELNIQDNHTLDLQFSRAGLSGETFRFYQMMNGVQVFDAEITVHVSNRNNVTFHQSTYDDTIETISTTPNITENQAFDIALTNLNVEGGVAFNKKQLFIYKLNENTKLVYEIIIEPKNTPIGSWEVIVDAQTGAIISSLDKAVYHNGKKNKKNKNSNNSRIMMVNGSGFVYETDPLTATTSGYGGQYVDNNDATNATLDAARTSVTLLDITQTGGQFFLTGPYAEVQDFESPNKGLFNQASSTFNFNRQQDGFEAVNVYYHIDKSMRYINETLGISLVPFQYTTGVRVDPSGLNGSDNSHYLPGSGRVSFGEGCVDDAEDADVILHELGHGIDDWLTNGSASNTNGEGNGDYWANSYKRSLGLWSVSDPARNWIFGWDGHNPCWQGRTAAYGGTYPGSLTGSIHTDGQIWATALMEVYDIIGKEKTDKAFLEGTAMTNSGTNQQNAAIAVRQAAIDMGTAHGYTCADIQAFTDRFVARGYNLPSYTCNLSVDEFAVNNISIFPNPTNGVISFKNIDKDHNVTVFNMLGQKVKDQTISETANTMDVSNLATGTYFVKFNGVDAVLKFIKE